ncbi:hypothetical protein K1719_042460 [Acacia pycnantha]|nr:hypothetical protein K1719_042460 [Acacia pycnantha]
MRNIILTITVLLAATTYQAAINPPGGVWSEDGAPSPTTCPPGAACPPAPERTTQVARTSIIATKMNRAHLSSQEKRVRRGKAASMSITSVLYLKDQVSIATTGAVDSVVKFWDTRNLKSSVTQTCPRLQTSEKERLHGISSLSQDQSGVFLSAFCMDNRIYLYNVLQLEKGPVRSFSGCRIESFFVKSAISPDASHIVSGSSDGNAYVWQINKPQEEPITLKTHDGEVTAVDRQFTSHIMPSKLLI